MTIPQRKIDVYKTAPTFLYNKAGDSKFFETQDQVDAGWGAGWFGPPWMLKHKEPLSSMEFETKAMMMDEMESDPRYAGLTLNLKKSVREIKGIIIEFEIRNGIIDPGDYDGDE